MLRFSIIAEFTDTQDGIKYNHENSSVNPKFIPILLFGGIDWEKLSLTDIYCNSGKYHLLC